MALTKYGTDSRRPNNFAVLLVPLYNLKQET